MRNFAILSNRWRKELRLAPLEFVGDKRTFGGRGGVHVSKHKVNSLLRGPEASTSRTGRCC